MTSPINTAVQDTFAPPTRTPSLIVIGDAAQGGAPAFGQPRLLEVPEGGLAIGRSPESFGTPAVWRLTHKHASTRHAMIRRVTDSVVVEDLGAPMARSWTAVVFAGQPP